MAVGGAVAGDGRVALLAGHRRRRVVARTLLEVLGADPLHDGLADVDLGDVDDGDGVALGRWRQRDLRARRRCRLDGLELLLEIVLVARLGDARAPQLVGDEEEDEHADSDEGAADPRHNSSDTHGRGGYGTDSMGPRHAVGRLDRRLGPPVASCIPWTASSSIFTPPSPSSAASPPWPASTSTWPPARSSSCRVRTARARR